MAADKSRTEGRGNRALAGCGRQHDTGLGQVGDSRIIGNGSIGPKDEEATAFAR